MKGTGLIRDKPGQNLAGQSHQGTGTAEVAVQCPLGLVTGWLLPLEGVAGVSNKCCCSLFSVKREDASREDEAVSRPLVIRGVMRLRSTTDPHLGQWPW